MLVREDHKFGMAYVSSWFDRNAIVYPVYLHPELAYCFDTFDSMLRDHRFQYLTRAPEHDLIPRSSAAVNPFDETTPRDTPIYGVQHVPVRWQKYRPLSQQFKNGIKGRWQKYNGYGWDNCNDGDDFLGWTK